MNSVDPFRNRSRRAQSSESPRGKKRGDGLEKEKTSTTRASAFTILVVDDETDLREAIAFDFKRKGFTVLTAESGNSALELVKSNKIDLVISDIRMPDGDGIFLLEQLRLQGIETPLIFITGFSDYSEATCIAKGAIRVVAKPFDRKALLVLVTEQLAKR
jgi:CheY-like chemotaxis protein